MNLESFIVGVELILLIIIRYYQKVVFTAVLAAVVDLSGPLHGF